MPDSYACRAGYDNQNQHYHPSGFGCGCRGYHGYQNWWLPPVQKRKVIRRINYLDKDLTTYNNENILIVDNGCDQTIFDFDLFLIHTFTGDLFSVNGAMALM